jgi:type II secretory pathway component PulK
MRRPKQPLFRRHPRQRGGSGTVWTTKLYQRERGSVLIIVLLICLGLVVLVLYFAESINSELQASANRVGDIEAKEAVESGIRYAAYILNNYAIDGIVPDNGVEPDPVTDYYSGTLEAGNQIGDQAGDPQFWFIGRDVNNPPGNDPVFCLVDESSKLNLNTVTATMLDQLPMVNMTDDFSQAIVAWRTRERGSNSSAESSLYSGMDPPRLNKGAPYESTFELRLVYGATLDLLFGEDTNLNGALDPNENDGDLSPPHDNQDGLLQPGMFEYVTAFSNQPTTTHSKGTRAGAARVNISNLAPTNPNYRMLQALLVRKGVGNGRASAILRNVSGRTYTSVADFMQASRMTAQEFALVHTSIMGTSSAGLVNVNTASEAVLACIPGIGPNNAPAVVNYRISNPTALTSFAWLPSVIGAAAIRRAGPYITDQSYQFSADIAAVGRFGRGYHRERVIFDTSLGTPRIIYRQDLTAYGWALGTAVRHAIETAHPY